MSITHDYIARDIRAMQAMIDNHMEWVRECPEFRLSHATEHLFWMRQMLRKALDELLMMPGLNDNARREAEKELRNVARAMISHY